MRRSIVWYVLAVILIAPGLLTRTACAQPDSAAVSVFIVDRSVVGTLLQPNAPAWQAVVAALGAPRVLICDPGGLNNCTLLAGDSVGLREANLRAMVAGWKPKPGENAYHVYLTELWRLFQYGYDELERYQESLHKTYLSDSEHTIRFTLVTRPDIYFRVSRDDTLTNGVPGAACLGRQDGSEFQAARPPANTIVDIHPLLDAPQWKLSQAANNFIAAIAGNVTAADGRPAGEFHFEQPSPMQCPNALPAPVTPLALKPDAASCSYIRIPVLVQMEPCPPPSEPQRQGKPTPPEQSPPSAPLAPRQQGAQGAGASLGQTNPPPPLKPPPAAPPPAQTATASPPVAPGPGATPAPSRSHAGPEPIAPVTRPVAEAPQAAPSPQIQERSTGEPAPTHATPPPVSPPAASKPSAGAAPPVVPPLPSPLAPPATASAPAASVVGAGITVTHPLGVQPQGQITARWAGDFPAGTVRLAIAGPASASGGVPAAPPGPSLNPATAPRGHYDVTMVVEGRASACSDSHLTGRVSVSGGGVAGFATDVDLVLLMCPNDNAVSVAIGGFDLP